MGRKRKGFLNKGPVLLSAVVLTVISSAIAAEGPAWASSPITVNVFQDAPGGCAETQVLVLSYFQNCGSVNNSANGPLLGAQAVDHNYSSIYGNFDLAVSAQASPAAPQVEEANGDELVTFSALTSLPQDEQSVTVSASFTITGSSISGPGTSPVPPPLNELPPFALAGSTAEIGIGSTVSRCTNGGQAIITTSDPQIYDVPSPGTHTFSAVLTCPNGGYISSVDPDAVEFVFTSSVSAASGNQTFVERASLSGHLSSVTFTPSP